MVLKDLIFLCKPYRLLECVAWVQPSSGTKEEQALKGDGRRTDKDSHTKKNILNKEIYFYADTFFQSF